ncbi:MAG: GNAT family N-acetyltransferase [Candidatus Eremiobacteraeota bacterium]|nr:GNAT family N-acetyltransferase [Candidatus Eremiobacteraeota bacterium]
MNIEIFGVDDATRLRRAIDVRTDVFVVEQSVPPELEIDEHDRTDPQSAHVILTEGSQTFAAGRFYRNEFGDAQIGRMAVRKSARGRGLGRMMLDALLEEAGRRGYSRATLHAQVHALDFYRKAGFTERGDHFDDAGIAHQEMSRLVGDHCHHG